jgi:rubrerythrin
MIVQGKTEVKPARPTSIEHRHPDDSMRKHYDRDTAAIKTKLNYHTIVSAEQQTMLFYRSHGSMYPDDIARQLYAEIAEVEEQHVTQYELLGDPAETMLEKMALLELNEAYLYHSCAQTESDPRIKGIWEMFTKMEITHFSECARLLKQHEGRDIRDIMQTDIIEPPVVFESNKDYVNSVIDTQLDLAPYNTEFMRVRDLPDNWASFGYLRVMNAKGVPSEEVVGKAGPDLAERDRAENIRRVKQEMARRVEKSMATVPAR